MRTPQLLIALLLAVSGTNVRADEALPRVLIIGDSIYRQPAAETAKVLKEKAEVILAELKAGEVLSSTTAMQKLDDWLDGDWDLIHFNVGLGDLVYRAPGMKSFRVFPKHAGGVRTTSPEQYETNLRELVKAFRAKAPQAKLVWASTTPIRHSTTDVFEMGSEIEYNAIAAKVMAEYNIPTNNMYDFVLDLIEMKKPAGHGADPFFFDRKPIHPPMVEAILNNLP